MDEGSQAEQNLGVPHNICCVQQGLARKPPRHARLVAVSGPTCQAIFSGSWVLAGARVVPSAKRQFRHLRFGLLLVSGAGASVWDWCSGWERRGRRLGASEQSSAGLGADRSGGGPKCWQRRSIPSESLAVFRPQARQVTAGGLKIASLSLHHYLLSCPAIEDYSGDSGRTSRRAGGGGCHRLAGANAGGTERGRRSVTTKSDITAREKPANRNQP